MRLQHIGQRQGQRGREPSVLHLFYGKEHVEMSLQDVAHLVCGAVGPFHAVCPGNERSVPHGNSIVFPYMVVSTNPVTNRDLS